MRPNLALLHTCIGNVVIIRTIAGLKVIVIYLN